MNCKYTLRHHLKTLEDYNKDLWESTLLDYPKKILITNALRKRINLIKEYLGIDYERPKKKSINEIFHESSKHIKR